MAMTLTEQLASALRVMGVKVPNFRPHVQNKRERVNPARRAKNAIRRHFGIRSGRAWVRVRREVVVELMR